MTPPIQSALGLKAKEPFVFSLDRWRAIQNCGLFKNLSAKGVSDPKTGRVIMEISGEELPAIRFTPEVSIGASLSNPEASGGISFEDKNFMGMGQKLEVVVAKKEGQQAGMAELPASISVHWHDCAVARPSKISMSFNEEHTFMDSVDQSPAFLEMRPCRGGAHRGAHKSSARDIPKSPTDRLKTMTRKILLSARDDFILDRGVRGADMGAAWGRVSVVLSHYRQSISSALYSATSEGDTGDSKDRMGCLALHGADVKAELLTSCGKVMTLKLDDGITQRVPDLPAAAPIPSSALRYETHRYTTVQAEAKLPQPNIGSFSFRYPDWLCRPLERALVYVPYFGASRTEGDFVKPPAAAGSGGASGRDGGRAPEEKKEQGDNVKVSRIVDVSATLRGSVRHTRGMGCVPLLHGTDLGGDRILRGYESASLSNHKVSSYLSTKGDIYADGIISGVVFGLFADGTMVPEQQESASASARQAASNPTSQAMLDLKQFFDSSRKHLTFGISARARGLRADVGWPSDMSTPPRLYLSADDD